MRFQRLAFLIAAGAMFLAIAAAGALIVGEQSDSAERSNRIAALEVSRLQAVIQARAEALAVVTQALVNDPEVVFADEKSAWFSHTFWRGSDRHAQVLVKMKFKKGGVTLPPARFVDAAGGDKPAYLEDWDRALGAL